MFDYVKCEYPLPKTKEVEDWNIDLLDVQFQTKDLENSLTEYLIKENGELYYFKNEYKWVDDDNSFLKGYLDVVSTEELKADFHGKIAFYHYDESLKKDGKNYCISLEYEAKFNDNIISDVKLIESKVEDITEHKQKMEKLFKEIKLQRSFWYNRFLWNTKIVLKIRKLICKFFYNLYRATYNLYLFVTRYI